MVVRGNPENDDGAAKKKERKLRLSLRIMFLSDKHQVLQGQAFTT